MALASDIVGHGHRTAGALLLVAALVAGCGETDSPSTSRGDDRPRDAATPLSDIDLEGAEVRVGSKDFSEQLVLGHVAHQALLAAGASAEAEIGSLGTTAAREALRSGETDLYWEYTGTAWIEFLGHDRPIQEASRQYDAVAREDRRRNGITWLERAPFNNTYALAVQADTADELDVDALSDLARLVDEQPADASVCIESEFASRRDGLPALERHYDFEFPEANVHHLDTGVIYGAIGSTCTFGEVFRTDPRIDTLDLVVLEDDEQFFPVYQPAVTIRSEVLERHPEIATVFERIAPRLDEETMIELNRRVDVDGNLPRQVAIDWLRDEGLID